MSFDGSSDARREPGARPEAGEVAIRVRGLTNRFGSKTVHEDLDLDVYAGETLGVVGPSGTGKSVLLNTIVGLNKPQKAEIEVFGQRIDQMTREQRVQVEQRWGVMFQDGALFSTLSVRENVMAPMREHLKLPRDLMRELADMKIRLTGLEADASNKKPGDLSGGMRKRAAMARALALDPDLLFLDEPTAGLDPISAARFDELINSLKGTMRLTVFLVTHDLDTLVATCDRIAVLNRGKVLAVGPMDEVRANPDPWIQEYFSGPRGRAAVK
ncbi:MAG: ATP-binding cassette domain-containing protein [Alphaproteobacteria bacterium]|nr:ATP-binding cassette domain-containing protein [Alphaproteobacteria bacterium]